MMSVDEFEQLYDATRVEQAGQRRRRPWWQYWDRPGEANNPFTGESS